MDLLALGFLRLEECGCRILERINRGIRIATRVAKGTAVSLIPPFPM